MSLSRRQFIGIGALAGAGSLATAYGYNQHTQIEVSRVEILLDRLPEEFNGLTIAHLSDLHHGRFISQDYIHHCVELTNALKPDLIALTGDFTFGAKAYAEPCGEVLQGLRANIGIYGVLGNHDHYNSAGRITRAIRSAGANVLVDQRENLEKGGRRLWIVGVDDLQHGHTDLPALLSDCPEKEFRLTLSHNPEFLDLFSDHQQHTDLMLSGHTHGGQIRLPLLGAPHLSLTGHKYVMGLNQFKGMQVYTTRGVGTVGPPVRLFCPPEIGFYTLRKGTPPK